MYGRYESWVERQIREAQERGEFDDLPGAGKPLDLPAGPPDDDWWIRGLIEREHLDMSAALPPQLALRKEREGLPERVLAARSEQAARELAEDFNARVRELWRRPIDGPLVVVGTVDVEELMHRRRAHHLPRRHHDEASRAAAPASAGPIRAGRDSRSMSARLRNLARRVRRRS